MKTHRHRLISAAILVTAGLWTSAFADEVGEARMRDQLRQTVIQLRQLQDENAELKAKLDTATQAIANQPAPKKEDDAQADNLRRTLQTETQKSGSLQKQVEQDKQALAQWQKSYDQAVAVAKARDAEAKKFEALYHEVDGHVKGCDDKNARLVQISDELLDRYKNKSVWDAAKDREPLTGLHRVELENLAQEYHNRVVDAKVVPGEAAPAQPQPPAQQQE